MRVKILIALLVGLIGASDVRAFSGYTPSTLDQLIKGSDAIVIARVSKWYTPPFYADKDSSMRKLTYPLTDFLTVYITVHIY